MSSIGIIAGGGSLPRKLADRCKDQGHDVFILGFHGHSDEDSFAAYPYKMIHLAQIGAALREFKKAKVQEIIMIGPIDKPAVKDLRLDFRGFIELCKFGMRPKSDDVILGFFRDLFESEGMKLRGAHEFMDDNVFPPGTLTKTKPSKKARMNIEYAMGIAKEVGRLDVGQSVVVQDNMIIGIEAIEGTDALIKRCADLKRDGDGPILVKSCKPQQDKRLDMPTIGLQTIQNAIAAGFSGIAAEAGSTLLVERDELVKAADEAGMFVVGI